MIVGSRRSDEEGDLLGAFGGAARLIDLDRPEYFVKEDMAAYALATLQLAGDERPGNPYADEEAAATVAQRIAALSDGNFLVAHRGRTGSCRRSSHSSLERVHTAFCRLHLRDGGAYISPSRQPWEVPSAAPRGGRRRMPRLPQSGLRGLHLLAAAGELGIAEVAAVKDNTPQNSKFRPCHRRL